MTIGSRIKSARKSRRMSQEELGNLVGIGKSSISDWESGKRAVPIDVVEQIAKILDVSVQYIMGWKEEPTVKKSTDLSPAAMELARRYDSLSEPTQKLITMITLFESADIGVRNRIIDVLVDHHNERMQRESAFDRASAELLSAISDPEDD